MILAGDIGATNTRLALYEEGPSLKKMAEGRFSSQSHPGLLPIVRLFLKQYEKIKPACAVFGIAGPVEHGRCQATNLPWVVDAQKMERDLGFPVSLLNDLEANAWGLRAMKPHDLFVLQAGVESSGNAALIAAGTGLGEAGLYWDGKRHHPFATEGGHTDFAPRNDLEIDLLRYLKKTHSHISSERIVSGPGIYLLYRFLVDTGIEKASKLVESEMKGNDPSLVISKWGLSKQDAVCTRAIEWFVSLYGAEAGNLSLKLMCRGGLYVGGKIAVDFLEAIREGDFLRSFCDKGRFSQLLKTIPVYVVLNEEASLLGAVEFARIMKT